MNNVLNAFKPKPGLAETQQNMQAKQDYYNDLNNFNTQVKTAQDTNKILPETATYLYKLIITTQKWLKDNPDASASDILTNRLDFSQTYQRIMNTEDSRRIILVWLATCAVSSKQLLTAKTITSGDNKYIQEKVIQPLNKWYITNEFTATLPEFEQQALSINTQLQTQFANNEPAMSFIKLQYETNSKLTPSQLSALLKQYNIVISTQTTDQKKQTNAVAANQALKEKQEEKIQKAKDDPVGTVQSTALDTFFTLLKYLFCILAGSLAANLAIGRSNMYRVLYFVYGCIPQFAPFVILYTIYRRVRFGPLHLYGILPLSVEPATTSLMKILWYPFYWIPDNYSIQQTKEFLESLKLPEGASIKE